MQGARRLARLGLSKAKMRSGEAERGVSEKRLVKTVLVDPVLVGG